LFSAVLFDFDGVLANSEPLHFRALREVLAEEGMALTEAEYYARYLGYNDVGALQAIFTDRGTPWTGTRVADLVDRKAVRMEELERHQSVLFPGAAEAVRRLAAATLLGIVSGALRAEIQRVLDQERLADSIAFVVASEDTPASKPAPDPYLRALGLLKAMRGVAPDPQRCVAIEDSVWGLQSARAAGLRTVAITHTYPSRVLEAAADAVIGGLDLLTVEFLSKIAQGPPV
jgi:HAD superfamily hydrolase (TIGR01509 family)